MKKLLLLLLVATSAFGQIATPFDNIKIKQNILNDTATRSLVQDATTGQVYFVAKVLPPFESLNEGNGIGFVLRGRAANVYGNIGLGSFDISTPATSPNSIYGATGNYSFATGVGNISSGLYSTTFGRGNSATVEGAFACGLYGVGGYLFSVGNGASGTLSNAFSISTTGDGVFSKALKIQDGTISMTNGHTFLGKNAGEGNAGDFNVALGNDTGKNKTGINSVDIGHNAGSDSTGDLGISIGTYAGFQNSGDRVIGLGSYAGAGNTFNNAYLFNVLTATNANQVAFKNDTNQINRINLTPNNTTHTLPSVSGTFGLSVNGVPFDSTGNVTVAGAGGGSGTVTTVSVAPVNGFSGVVSSPTTTPTITLSTSISGILKGASNALAPATVADFPTLNQNTTGTAAGITGVAAIANGGTGQTTATTALTALLPLQTGNSPKVLQTDGTTASWQLATLSVNNNTPSATGNVTLTADNIANGVTNKYFTNLTGEVTSVGATTTVTNASVIGKVLTGYTSGAGTVSATDNILQAVQKLNGNDALKLTANTAITGATFPKITYDSKGLVLSGSALLSTDIPTLNQNTTGTAANVTGVVAIANGGTNSTATATAGGVGYGTGTAHAYTAAGAANQVLISNGTVPVWATTLPVSALPFSTRSTIAASAAINTTATYISPTTFTIPANSIAVGDVFKITIYGTNTSTLAGVNTFTPRLGALGTTADAALTPFAVTSSAAGVAVPFCLTITATARAIGASGSFYTYGVLDNQGITGISASATAVNTGTAVTINTTGALILGASLVTAATTTTTTIQSCIVQKLQ